MIKIIFTSLACLTLLGSFKAHAEDYWFNAEYLYWKIQDANKVIPLVVEGSTSPGDGSILVPGREVVIGDEKIESKWRSGGRFTFGFMCPNMCDVGIEASYFFLGKSSTKKSVFSSGEPGSPYLGFPYINSNTGLETSLNIATPGSFGGLASLKVSNSLQGAELYASMPLTCFNGWNMNAFGGFRYLNFNEKLDFYVNNPFIDPVLNDVFFTNDRFKMDNNFYGGSLGVNALYQCNCLMFNLKAQVALGAMCQSSKIRGNLEANDFTNYTTVESYNGGYLALPSNSGTKKRTQFSVIPEVELNVGYNVTECLALTLGYNFLYVTNVLRAPNQLNSTVNPTQSSLYEFIPDPVLVGDPQPQHRLKSSDMWVQGVNVGLVYTF